jgi:TRAP-type C4-dicarboxylate transport system permease small subunit
VSQGVNAIKRFEKALGQIEALAIIFLLYLMVVLTFFQVILRSLYTHAQFQWANTLMGHLDWTEPLVRLLVLWLAFLGSSLITAENRHIKIDLFSSILSSRWLPLRELVLSSASALVCIIMLKVCIGYVRLEKEFGGALFLNFPTWLAQIILPIGFAFMLFRFLLRALEHGLSLKRGAMKI